LCLTKVDRRAVTPGGKERWFANPAADKRYTLNTKTGEWR
jgi:hypothetical protein